MKQILSKFSILLCLLFQSIGYVNAQSVTFTHNRYRGAQAPSNIYWRDYDALSLTSNSDWIQFGNSWYSNGAITNQGRYVIQRYNTGWWSGDLFDWFTLSYTAPSYTKATYKLNVVVEATHDKGYDYVRAAYFDYGTNYSYWSSWVRDPKGRYDFCTAVGSSSTMQGETLMALTEKNESNKRDQISVSVTVDNSTGSATATSYRYGGFLSTKTQSASGLTYGHYSKLYMWYTGYTCTYYKHVTFNANGGTGTMSKQTVQTSANLTANKFTREGFDFAGWNTKVDGTGTSYANGATITATSTSKGPVTLYAQWTAKPIIAKFDYTYRTSDVAGGAETYVHMPETVQSGENPFTKKVRVNLRNASGAVLWSDILTAPAATTPSTTPTADIATHKTAAITLKVVKGSGSTNTISTSGSTNIVTLTAANYTNYRSVDFEVMNADGSAKASHWASTKQNATNYLFKYEGHESSNMFYLTWTVNLKNLSTYPSHIFVKPMRKGTHSDNGGSTTLEQIPAMQNTDGIECKFAGNIYEDNEIVGAYYTGEYKVLTTCVHAQPYNYEIGLTGFILSGITYYLAETEGDVPTDMISSAVASSTSANITFDRLNKDIPVLLLDPNVNANFQLPEDRRATINGQIYQLYVDNGTNVDSEGKRIVNLEQFEAVRPGYTFTGWKDEHDNTEYAYNSDYHFNMGTKATTTLQAQWERTNAPVLVSKDMVENENNFIYDVIVTDEIDDIQSVKYIYTDTDTEPAVDAQDWKVLPVSNGNYTLTIPMFNEYHGKYLWVKAANTDKTSIINLGTVRSIYRVKANPDPDSHVLEKIENGTWTEPTEEDPVFTPDGTYTNINYYDYYSTFYFGDRTFIAANASVYTAQINGNHLDLTEIKPSSENAPVIIPEGTAVILRKKHDTDGEIVLEECARSIDKYSNVLEGVDENTTQDGDNYYIFSYAQKGLGFYRNSSTTLAAHKAFIKLDKYSSNARAFTLNFGDSETTGITDIECTDVEDNTIYDLSGRQVNAANAKGGIYIKGGKKVMIK